MSFLARIRVTLAVLISASLIGLLYVEVALPLINMGTGDGQFTGPFSDVLSQVETVVPLVISLLLLGIVVWLLASSVQEETRRRVRR